MSGSIAATRAATGRPLDILLWCVQAFLALVFVSSSWAKLMGNAEFVALFTAVGPLHLARSTHYTGRPVSYVRLRRVGTAVTCPAS